MENLWPEQKSLAFSGRQNQAVSVKTDSNGHYVIPNVPPGGHYLKARVDGYIIAQSIVKVIGAGTAVSNFKLSSGSLSISGKVQSKQSGAAIECKIYLMKSGVLAATGQTKSGDGKFAFDNLTPDHYEITVDSPGHASKAWWGEIKKSEVVNFSLDER